MPLELEFVEVLIVKAAEFPREPAERADQTKLAGEVVSYESKLDFLGKSQACLGFALQPEE
jgi:hypothetical protein